MTMCDSNIKDCLYRLPCGICTYSVLVADVQPAERGEWIQVVRRGITDVEYRLTRCSACGYEMNNEVFFEPWDFHYCPNCGADMER